MAHRFFQVFLSIEFFFFLKKNTHRIERIEPFLDITQRIEPFFSQFDSKNCSFFFFLNLTQRIVPSFFHDSNTWTFFHMTQRIELSFLRDSNTWTFLKKWTLCSGRIINKKNSQNWIFLNPTHRIDFFCDLNRLISWIWRKELNRLISWIWRKDLNHFFKITLKEFLYLNKTQRIELFFFLNMT